VILGADVIFQEGTLGMETDEVTTDPSKSMILSHRTKNLLMRRQFSNLKFGPRRYITMHHLAPNQIPRKSRKLPEDIKKLE
jgi:hypothetical protein